MSPRTGWTIIAVGVGLCLIAWLGFALAAHLFGYELGERMIDYAR